MTDNPTESPDQSNDFQKAAEAERMGLAAEFWDFLKHNKKWWLLPILLAMVGIGVIIALGSTGAAPFIYPLF
ncbi:MAG TPA: DUF5989 family protein [Phycisphaerae bacterium]|nr:DUF5989 family protein [Phycisphaerae bacterium]